MRTGLILRNMTVTPRPAVRASFEHQGAGELAAFGAILLRSGGSRTQARQIAANDPRLPSRVAEIIEKAGAASTTDETWATALGPYRIANRTFLESLRSLSVFDSALPLMRAVPRNVRAVATTLAATGAAVTEGNYKPVSELSLSGQTLAERKVATIVAMTSELAELAGAEAQSFFNDELRRATATATDSLFIDELKALTTPLVSVGSDAASVRADLAAMIAGMGLTSASRPFWILSVELATALSLMQGAIGSEQQTFGPQGGRWMTFPAYVSDALESTEALLVDAGRIAADGGTVLMDSATHASLAMADSPSEGAQSLLSLWQTNAKALKCERLFGFEMLGDAAVLLTGAVWGEGPDSP